MKVPFSNLFAQYQSIKGEIDQAINSVIEKSAFIGTSTNPFIREFEEKFAAYSGSQHCISCANGTDAIEIALKALEIGPGDEVIVPALTWISTAEAVSNIGAVPVFAGIHPEFFTISASSVKEKLSKKTKCIIPVHLYGQPADMNEIMKIARDNNLYVIEDCAQAHGAVFNGKKAGTFGNLATFSFFPGKNLGAMGDAGGIITNDENLAKKCRMISQHGQLDKKHQHYLIGRNSRMDGIQAAVLSVKLKYIEKWTQERIEIAQNYLRSIDNSAIHLPKAMNDARHVYHLFVLQSEKRNELAGFLAENNIESAIQYPRLLTVMEIFENKESYKIAEKITEKIISIPLFPEMDNGMIQYVTDVLNNFK